MSKCKLLKDKNWAVRNVPIYGKKGESYEIPSHLVSAFVEQEVIKAPKAPEIPSPKSVGKDAKDKSVGSDAKDK